MAKKRKRRRRRNKPTHYPAFVGLRLPQIVVDRIDELTLNRSDFIRDTLIKDLGIDLDLEIDL